MRDILPLHAEFSIQSTVWQKDAGHFLMLKMRLIQIRTGVDMGVGLHSRKTAVKIVDHIAKNIKNEIFAKIIEQNLKICIIVDEASPISHKPVLIIFFED